MIELTHPDRFVTRHLGPRDEELSAMLAAVKAPSLDALIDQTVPESIRMRQPLKLPAARTEHEVLAHVRSVGQKNQIFRSLLGMGYADCITPPVIQRNVIENPGWYTQYTPYQAEIAQGRLEALLNFQTMVSDLTALEVANASLLDEATAAAEAMHMMYDAKGSPERNTLFVASDCHPQTIAVLRTRAEVHDIAVLVGDAATFDFSTPIFGAVLQYPGTDGAVVDPRGFIERAHKAGALVTMAADLLSLLVLTPPGELGADVAVGNSQRFGVPLGYGGPHAAYLATRNEHVRRLPGRIIGVSVDAQGKPALRMALQTREQHIRREKATSNICTAQALLAIMAGLYAVYHGPRGLRAIAERVHGAALVLAAGLGRLGCKLRHARFFDTLAVEGTAEQVDAWIKAALDHRINLRRLGPTALAVALDELTDAAELDALFEVFAGKAPGFTAAELASGLSIDAAAPLTRQSGYLTHPVFHSYHSETEMLRYLRRLEGRDLSLAFGMIPLGSCTMKLNATAEMMPVTWPEWNKLHPFAPADQAQGYRVVAEQLESMLAEITGFAATSLQPNAGSQGEYAGLLVIRKFHLSRGQGHRKVCLIPSSAHGTNPASAVMAGMEVVVVRCDERGNVDLADLEQKAKTHSDRLAALMVTYPSTHGVFEEDIKKICTIVHEHGGQVYMDGANMNAQVGLCRPGDIGADVCHLNLHKTFCLSAGTPVAMGSGTARRIEQLLPGGAVYGWSDDDKGVRSARLDAVFATGRKPCIEVTLQDGRTLTCTDDHRLLTTQGWVEAGKLDPSRHRVVVGPEAPLDDPTEDAEAEQRFQVTYGGFSLSMDTLATRDRTLAFFRLLGAACSDGTHSEDQSTGRTVVRLYFGTQYDASKAIEDIALLTGVNPTISTCNGIFSVRLPAELIRAFGSVPGFGEPGRRVLSARTLPDIINDLRTPKAVLREFLAALFGGDGCAPVVLHLTKNPKTMKEVRFTQSRTDQTVIAALLEQICNALGRLGVAAVANRLTKPAQQRACDAAERPRWVGTLSVVDSLAFAERVGFRYCAHKTARLSAAAAWWRMKSTIKAQKLAVAQRALDKVTGEGRGPSGPKAVWGPAVAEAYREFAAEQPVLNPYYASFQGFARLSKKHLTNAIEGQKGKRAGICGERRTHQRVTVAARGRGGEDTGMPGLEAFLAEIGAEAWFNKHTPGGKGYSVTYAIAQDAAVEPTMNLGVLAVRPVGEREVYDLTVADLHSFLANGAVVHNCIPHGGGGPGMGPICVAKHLAPYLPSHPVVAMGGSDPIGPVSAAPWGSPSILLISWIYILMMGPDGLTQATKLAILNANYVASLLDPHYPVFYKGKQGRVAHECILDMRHFKASAGIEVDDIAKRLMDYGFHAPTMSFPIPATMMVEPTESESKYELDRFVEAMIAIREEIRAAEENRVPRDNNPLKHAPHTAEVVAGSWDRPYSREQAAFPTAATRQRKFWPAVGRVNNAQGDRKLVCTCPPTSAYEKLAPCAPGPSPRSAPRCSPQSRRGPTSPPPALPPAPAPRPRPAPPTAPRRPRRPAAPPRHRAPRRPHAATRWASATRPASRARARPRASPQALRPLRSRRSRRWRRWRGGARGLALVAETPRGGFVGSLPR